MALCHDGTLMTADVFEDVDIDSAPDVVECSEADESKVGEKNTNDEDEALIMALLHQNLFEGDATVVKLALQGLTDICYTADGQADAHYRRLIGRHDGPRVIAHAMEHFAWNADIQTEGLLALGNLTCDNGENKICVFTTGGARSTVQTMRQHAKHERVQEYGCLLLRNLSYGPGGNAKLVAEVGGIQAIVRAMGAFPGNAYVQRDATAALWNMAESSEELKVEVIRLGGPGLIEKAIQRGHCFERGVVKRCATTVLKSLLG